MKKKHDLRKDIEFEVDEDYGYSFSIACEHHKPIK